MARLYDLTNEYTELLSRLESEAEANEGVIPQALIDEVVAKEEAFEIKAESIIKAIKNYENDEKAFAEAIETFQRKKKSAKKSVDYLKTLLASCMGSVGKDRIKTSLFKVSTVTNYAVLIEDADVVPAEFKRVTVEVSKSDIKEALKSGTEVAGARLEKTQSLRIS